MSDDGELSPETTPEQKTKLEKGTEDYNLFHNLIDTVPDFLSLTAAKIKQRFPPFLAYLTNIINTALQNTKRMQKQKEASKKKEEAGGEKQGKEKTEEEKS